MDSQETRIAVALAIATFLISLVLILLVILLFNQYRKNLILQQKVLLSEIATLDFERTRIAADLHDDLGPLLAAIKLRVQLLKPSTCEDQDEINLSVSHLDDALQRLRKISNNLLPTSLERKGLVDALDELIIQSQRLSDFSIDFEKDHIPSLSKHYEVHIYRIIQEGIANCIKYAEATQMRITFTCKDKVINLQMADNGKGLPTNFALDPLSGRGLVNLKNRATIMGGELIIHSRPSIGTILEFEIPVHA